MAEGGASFWVPHETAVWLPGKLTCTALTYSTELGEVTVPADQTLEEITDASIFEGVEDCCTLSSVSPASILHIVRARFARGDIYTYVSNVLIAMNPFKPLSIYGTEYLTRYHQARDPTSLPPHVFGICAQAFAGLLENHGSQAVLISGESGAGKTETTKLVLLYTSEALSGQEGGLEDMVVEVNPILEAFGNAKTVRNNNSSRFGKWIEVQVEPSKRNLCGVRIIDYLLEVTRVCDQGPGERNYHIFYQLAADSSQRDSLQLTNASEMPYLKSNSMTIPGVDDAQDLLLLRKALSTLNFSPGEENSIFKIAAGILHIGSLAISGADTSSIDNPDSLKIASDLLRVKSEELSKCILFKRIATGSDVCFSPLSQDRARQARDSIAKLMYSRLFTWLVGRCNRALGEGIGCCDDDSCGGTLRERALFLGVLDIAGFESFETNLLEQLLINLSNEKLQQFFNNVVFKAQLAEYKEEGIPIADIKFADNVDVLELIEGPGGILVLLDDSATGVKQTDALFTQKAIKEKEKHARFIKPKFANELRFGIRHYAGDVMYSTEGFLEKNLSSQPSEVLDLMRSSELVVLQAIGRDPEEPAGKGPGKPGAAGCKRKKATVGSSFRQSLKQLMEKLSDAECNFIRCIKPNTEKVPEKFTAPMVMDQLRLCGVFETVEIRKAGYLVRQKCHDFVSRYMMVVPKDARAGILAEAGLKALSAGMVAEDARKVAKSLLEALKPEPAVTAVGHTKVFIKAQFYRTLEERRRMALQPSAVKIQSLWRGHKVRSSMVQVREVSTLLRKCMEDAGHSLGATCIASSRVDRATLAEGNLSMFDVAMVRALNLPIKLPYLHEATKVRAHLQARANLARKMVDMKNSTDVPEMQALVGQAASHKMEGDLVQAMVERIAAVNEQSHARRLLQNCLAYEGVAEVRAAVEKAKEQGFDAPEKWLIPSGWEAMSKAVARLAELEEKARETADRRAKLERSLDAGLQSVDVREIQVLLAQAESEGVEGELVCRLFERCKALERQTQLQNSLRSCGAFDKIESIEKVLRAAEEEGYHTPENWILPGGVKELDKAKARLAELQSSHKKSAEESVEMEKELQSLAKSSQDIPAMEAAVAKARGICKEDLVNAVSSRLEKIKEQIPHRRALLNCAVFDSAADVAPVIEAAEKVGLDDPDTWVLPDGHSVYLKAKSRVESLDRSVSVKARIAAAAEKFDPAELEASFDEANSLGILQSEYVKAHRIFTKLQNPHHVRGFIQENAGNEEALANLSRQLEKLMGGAEGETEAAPESVIDRQLKSLLNSCDVHAMQAVIARADSCHLESEMVDQVRERCRALQEQLPHLQALKNCVSRSAPEEMQKAIDEAKAAGFDDPAKWLLPEGPKVLETAAGQLAQLLSEDREEKDSLVDLSSQLQEMRDSKDVAQMRVLLKRAEAKGLTGIVVDHVQSRLENLQKQQEYIRQLRNCAVYNDSNAVQATIMEVIDAGYKPTEDRWLCSEGPKVLQQAIERLKELLNQQAATGDMQQQVEAEIVELLESTDLPAMRAMITKIIAYNVKKQIAIKLNMRYHGLLAQEQVLEALRHCLAYESVEEVQEVIKRAQGTGLDHRKNWLWPEGPHAFETAMAHESHLWALQSLKNTLSTAMRDYNVKDLGATIHAMQEREVAEHVYQEANTLFVNLQNGAFVEATLAEVRARDDNDPQDMLVVSNLVEQLNALGLKVDSEAMQDVASRMARGRAHSVWDSQEDTEKELAGKVFDDFANFSQLRNPLTWGQRAWWPGNWNKDANRGVQSILSASMLKFQNERISEPLTHLFGDKDAEMAAVKNFMDILRCMGDKPSSYIADLEAPILGRATAENIGLCDEVYVQVMKQLTNNPSTQSSTNGWLLFRKLVQTAALPSDELREFVRAFLQKAARRDGAAPLKPSESKDSLGTAALSKPSESKDSLGTVTPSETEEEQPSEPATPLTGVRALWARARGPAYMFRSQPRRRRLKSRFAIAEQRREGFAAMRTENKEKQVEIAREVLLNFLERTGSDIAW